MPVHSLLISGCEIDCGLLCAKRCRVPSLILRRETAPNYPAKLKCVLCVITECPSVVVVDGQLNHRMSQLGTAGKLDTKWSWQSAGSGAQLIG